MHWAERYVGLPYVPGSCDCAALAGRVQREQFGRDVALPGERAEGIRGQAWQIISLAGDYADPTDAPEEGDAVLMLARGRLAHVGILCVIAGRRYVLHAMKSAGQVCLHPVTRLADMGLPVEGYYRWR